MTLTVEELIKVLEGFDKDLPIQIGADGVAWEIIGTSSIFTQEIDGKQNVVIWDGYRRTS